MKIQILAMGTKMPTWVQQGCDEYAKRLPKEFTINIKELSLASRSKTTSTKTVIEAESDKLLAAVPEGYQLVVLDKGGSAWSTEQLADNIRHWQMQGQSLALIIGGPDGLSRSCIRKADKVWSLSALTLPHPIVRIVLLEQFYRAWAILNHHPYHK